MTELVNHPSYYAQCSEATRPIVMLLGIPHEWLDEECIIAIENNHFAHTSFHMGEVITHLWRYGKKPLECRKDLEKSQWYLRRINERYPSNLKFLDHVKAIAMIDKLIAKDFDNA
jgi:Protein of unknwon function (DUF3310)